MLNLTDKANLGSQVALRAPTRLASPPEQAGDREEANRFEGHAVFSMLASINAINLKCQA
jgi:hypothetical protein